MLFAGDVAKRARRGCPAVLDKTNTSMATPDTLRYASIPLVHATGVIPAVGFGTLIHDHVAARQASKTALEVGYRHLDCAERYRTEEAVGEAMQESFRAGTIRRVDVFVTTKLWNTNHRPERVKPAFDASRRRLQIDYVDCYMIHTPFAFQPGDDQDPTDERGQPYRLLSGTGDCRPSRGAAGACLIAQNRRRPRDQRYRRPRAQDARSGCVRLGRPTRNCGPDQLN
jgi:hypothetical protein